MRFETNESFNDHVGRAALAAALFAVGAKRMRLRGAYGVSRHPHVVTFAANSQEHANNLADAARRLLSNEGEQPMPALFALHYKRY